MQIIKKHSLLRLLPALMMIMAISCVPLSKVQYFTDTNELEEPGVNPRVQKTILPFDKLFIKILSTDLATSQIFNSSDELRSSGGNNAAIGYLVDETGNIVFPFVGKINVGRLTTALAAEKIQKALNDYVSNTSIIVNFVNNQVTVMGEVQRQGVYPFTQDKLNIYEAIAMGGGLTRYGNRKNVILIRQEGEKIFHHILNLTDSRISGKAYYYILPNDVIVVEPLKSVSSSYQNITYSTILTSVTTLIAVLLFTGLKF